MGAPDPNSGGAGGDAPEQHNSAGTTPPGSLPRFGGAGGEHVDYQWLQEQLAQLGAQLGSAHLEDELEDEFEDWRDPSDGLLTAIFEACETGDTAALAPLLTRLADSAWDANTPGPDGDTPLHVAALYGSEGCVSALLTAGARADSVNRDDGTTPLHDAAAGGYCDILQALATAAREQLAWRRPGSTGGEQQQQQQQHQQEGTAAAADGFKAFVNWKDGEGETALHCAARGNHLAAVRLLLSWGADPLAAAQGGQVAAEEADDEEVVALLNEAMDTAVTGQGGSGDADTTSAPAAAAGTS